MPTSGLFGKINPVRYFVGREFENTSLSYKLQCAMAKPYNHELRLEAISPEKIAVLKAPNRPEIKALPRPKRPYSEFNDMVVDPVKALKVVNGYHAR